jgi:ankyrin repeat protein
MFSNKIHSLFFTKFVFFNKTEMNNEEENYLTYFLDAWPIVFSFVKDKGDWKCLKLTCKTFRDIGDKTFHPTIESLKFSVRKNYLESVRFVINDGIDPSADNNYAIRKASEHGRLEVVKELLKDKRVDPAANINYAIENASNNGHLEVVKELLKDNRVDPSVRNNYAIVSASEYGHLEVVKELLKDKRVDPSAHNNWAIQSASKNGYLEVVKELLQDPRVDPSVNDNDATKWASLYGHSEIVNVLSKDIRVSSKNPPLL